MPHCGGGIVCDCLSRRGLVNLCASLRGGLVCDCLSKRGLLNLIVPRWGGTCVWLRGSLCVIVSLKEYLWILSCLAEGSFVNLIVPQWVRACDVIACRKVLWLLSEISKWCPSQVRNVKFFVQFCSLQLQLFLWEAVEREREGVLFT